VDVKHDSWSETHASQAKAFKSLQLNLLRFLRGQQNIVLTDLMQHSCEHQVTAAETGRLLRRISVCLGCASTLNRYQKNG
jgi:hypothetical protein